MLLGAVTAVVSPLSRMGGPGWWVLTVALVAAMAGRCARGAAARLRHDHDARQPDSVWAWP